MYMGSDIVLIKLLPLTFTFRNIFPRMGSYYLSEQPFIQGSFSCPSADWCASFDCGGRPSPIIVPRSSILLRRLCRYSRGNDDDESDPLDGELCKVRAGDDIDPPGDEELRPERAGDESDPPDDEFFRESAGDELFRDSAGDKLCREDDDSSDGNDSVDADGHNTSFNDF